MTPDGSTTQESKEVGLLGFIEGRPAPVADLEDDRVPTYPHLIMREFLAFGVMLMVLLIVSVLFNAPLEEIANPGKTPNPAKAPWYFLSLQEMLHYAPPFIAGVFIPGLLVLTMCTIPYYRGRMVLVPVGFVICALVVPLFDGLIWSGIHAIAPGFADTIRIYGLPTIFLLIVAYFVVAKWSLNPRFDDPAVVEKYRKRMFVAFVIMLFILVMIGSYFRGPEWRWVWPWQH